MEEPDADLLTEVLHRILLDRATSSAPEGWVDVDDACAAVGVALQVEVTAEQLLSLVRGLRSFDLRDARVRAIARPRPPAVPDILFHATHAAGEDEVRQSGVLQAPRRRLWLSADQAQAWRVAHRLGSVGGRPRLIVVDAARARRSGVCFQRARHPGLFTSSPVPIRHLVSLKERYGEQWSAGGVPVRRFPDGTLRFALIQVTRRSGTTWEVAKGKLEQGESPEDAAVREVREEMGLSSQLRVICHIGDVRYAFLAPGGAPGLKTIYLYLMELLGDDSPFEPAIGEGIGAVRWFLPEDAARAVVHTSLQPLMWRAVDLVASHGSISGADLLP